MIYVVSPANYVTGGTETLHQVADLINHIGYAAKMYYPGADDAEIPERFKKYNLEVADHIEDKNENILIISEIYTHLLKNYKQIRICIWWLSVDFFYSGSISKTVSSRMKAHGMVSILYPAAFIYLLIRGKINFNRYKEYRERYNFENSGKYFHAYNCEYAHRYVVENGVPENKTLYLCGPLNQTFFDRADQIKNTKKLNQEKRQNIILYNPKKGRYFTEKIITASKKAGIDAEFIPLQNMSPDQISELMSRAKIYMDFGEFPGPERIPREAVTMGCNIITSRNGAAANDVDVPIPDELKFEDKKGNIPAIIEKLQDMLEHYENYYPLYDTYRQKVRNQILLFENNAKMLIDAIEGLNEDGK